MSSGGCEGSTLATVETMQKRLARELRSDTAATSCAQTTRLPGFVNYKRLTPFTGHDRIPASECGALEPTIFLGLGRSFQPTTQRPSFKRSHLADRAARAQRFLLAVEPAVAGQHGDLRTFRICCRVVRGFELSDHEAISVLSEWNARCQPPWSERELLMKVQNARKYGREPLGGSRRRQRMSATHA